MIQNKLAIVFVSITILSLSINPAYSKNWAERTFINGFLTAAYNISNSRHFFKGGFDQAGINHDGSFKNTQVGINIRSQVTERIGFAAQLLSRIDEDQYSTKLIWGFTSITLFDSLALRVGKIKYPVGLVNEFIGITYPWIDPPISVYADQINGSQATRESYTGMSLLEEYALGNWLLAADLFVGEVDLRAMNIKNARGLTLRSDWNDIILFQGSYYIGTMKQSIPDMWMSSPTDSMEMKMHNQDHEAIVTGVKLDWAGIILYAERADVKMEMLMRIKGTNTVMTSDARNSTSYYATLGYRIRDLLPHITFQKWKNKAGTGNTLTSIGVNYHFSDFTVFKMEFSDISFSNNGLLQVTGDSNNAEVNVSESVLLYKIALDLVF